LYNSSVGSIYESAAGDLLKRASLSKDLCCPGIRSTSRQAEFETIR
jgi:hypothetical protein